MRTGYYIVCMLLSYTSIVLNVHITHGCEIIIFIISMRLGIN